MAEIAVSLEDGGAAYVALVVGEPPEVRNSVALDELDAADEIPALDGLVLDFDHYGRLVGLRVTGVGGLGAGAVAPGVGYALTRCSANHAAAAQAAVARPGAVDVVVAAVEQQEPLGLAGPLVRAEDLVGRRDRVLAHADHEQRRRRHALDVGARLVLGVALERPQLTSLVQRARRTGSVAAWCASH